MRCNKNLLDFFEYIGNGNDNARDSATAKHADDRNWREFVSIQWREKKGVIVLYCSGVQKGSTDMANRVPMIDTGIVDPSMPKSTDMNCARNKQRIRLKGH